MYPNRLIGAGKRLKGEIIKSLEPVDSAQKSVQLMRAVTFYLHFILDMNIEYFTSMTFFIKHN